ncbi:MAG: peptidoglycan-binding protein, partial [Clostridia bacterium]|nr:peptidoglycan-binding protein [Clostridia bacterium]
MGMLEGVFLRLYSIGNFCRSRKYVKEVRQMNKFHQARVENSTRGRRIIALLLAATMLCALLPALPALALTANTLTFAQFSTGVTLYSATSPYPAVDTVAAGSVFPRESTITTNSADGTPCYTVFYNGARYLVSKALFDAATMVDTALYSYITTTLWKMELPSVKEATAPVPSVNVAAVQLALNVLGYYTGTPDAAFGAATQSAIRNFQRAAGLTVDGSAGPNTQEKLFAQALAKIATIITPTTTTTPTTSAGASAAITPSADKVYCRLPKDVYLYTAEADNGTNAVGALPMGTVVQMVANSTYSVNGVPYACIYYVNDRYNVKYAEISSGIMSSAQLQDYIIGTLWRQTEFTSINQDSGKTGSVATHSLQMALTVLGYYNG